MATLLSIIQGAALRVGIAPAPATGITGDPNGRALVEAARQEARALARRHDWSALVKEKTFTTTATETQTGALPTDYDRMTPGSFMNRSLVREVRGPLTSQEWQALQALNVAPIFDRFRIRGGLLLIFPAPAAGQTMAFEYVTNQWCTSSLGVAQSDWLADTDLPLLDAELLTLGVVWRYLQAKGFEYSEAFRSYEMAVSDAMGRDGGGKQTLSLAPSRMGGLADPYIQEGNWPG